MSSFNIFDPNRREINGIANVIRLEGKIDGNIRKVIYIFVTMDVAISRESECSNVHSQDFDKYLIESFDKLNKIDQTFDMFYEPYGSIASNSSIRKNRINTQRSGEKSNYLSQFLRLIRSVVESGDDDPYRVSRVFQNVRFHDLDVHRILLQTILYPLRFSISQCLDTFEITSEMFSELENLKVMLNNYLSIFDSASGGQDIPKTSINTITIYFRKLLSSYKHSHVQKIISKIFSSNIDTFSELSSNIDQLQKKLQEYRNTLRSYNKVYLLNDRPYYGPSTEELINIFGDVHINFENITAATVQATTGIMCCLVLRRILDKDYIKHSIVYAGVMHAIMYVQTLVAEFDFDITFIANSSIPMDSLKDQIKSRYQHQQSIGDLLIVNDRIHCSDITDMPSNFL